MAASGVSDGGQVQAWDLLVGAARIAVSGREAGGGEVAFGEVVRDHEVGDVDDGDGQVLVEASSPMSQVQPPPCSRSIG